MLHLNQDYVRWFFFPLVAYGDQGFGDIIPAKSTLVFDIELMDLKDDDGTGEAASFQGGEHEHEHPDSFEGLCL